MKDEKFCHSLLPNLQTKSCGVTIQMKLGSHRQKFGFGTVLQSLDFKLAFLILFFLRVRLGVKG